MMFFMRAPAPPRPDVREVVLIMADISGYTRFAAANRTALEHSQRLVVELLDALIREADLPLRIAKLEGDAVFLYAEKGGDWDRARRRIRERLGFFFSAFARRLAEVSRTITCNCEMCANVDRLRLKVLVHSGEALFTRVGGFNELLGIDVILAHRLLKNSVEEDEYLLFTGAALSDLGLPADQARPGVECYDSIGEVPTFLFRPRFQHGEPWSGT
jgi:class 3 adenylate cyclase